MSVLVSVIMPTYNCGKYIAASINSVIAQTVMDWEIQIVDDCSTDNTNDVLKPYLAKHSNIYNYRLPQNDGPAVARTEAIKRATGKYCAFLDSDDLWTPDKLEKQIAFMERTGAKFSCTAYSQIDIDGQNLHTVMVPPKKTNYQKCLRLSNPIGNLTVIVNDKTNCAFKLSDSSSEDALLVPSVPC